MTNTQHKPVPHSTPAAARPVADARARALQEQIRGLREQARQAGDRLLQAGERGRARLQAEWERAELACRQAERQMASLRAQALGAAPSGSSTAFDRPQPASLRPDEALEQPTRTAPPRPTALNPTQLDPDRGCDRGQTAMAALGLLERASQTLLENSPILDRGLARPSDTARVEPAGIDFGPLVEDAMEASPAPPVARSTASAPRPPADAARSTPKSAPNVAVTARPVPSTPAPQARLAPVATPPAASRSGGKSPRARFAAALLLGALLGGMIILLATTWLVPRLSAGSPWQASLQEQGQRLQEAGAALRQSWPRGA